MALSRPDTTPDSSPGESKPKSGGRKKAKSIKREYTDFEQFVTDINDVNTHLISATFRPGMQVDLTRLANFITEGKCKWLTTLSLEGVKFINVPADENKLQRLVDALKLVDQNPNDRLLPKAFTLNLANTDLTPADAKVLATVLPKFPEISLLLDNNLLGDEGAVAFAQGLEALEQKVARKISLSLQNNGIHDAGIKAFIQIFSGEFADFNLKWSIMLGNRRKDAVKGRENKYAAGEMSDLFQQIKSDHIFPLFRGNNAIVKVSGCALGKLIQQEWQKRSPGVRAILPMQTPFAATPPTVAKNGSDTKESVMYELHPSSGSQRFFIQQQLQVQEEREAEKRSYKPFAQITRRQFGIPAGESADLEPLPFDDGGSSSIYGVRLYSDYQNGINKAQPKTSNDIIILGYTHHGLPFQIVIKSHHDVSPGLSEFIRQHILRAIPKCADDLVKSERYQTVIHALIKEIYALQAEHASDTSFAMAIGIMYEQTEVMHCAGFSIGDVRLTLLHNNGDQLSTHLAGPRNGTALKDAFNAVCGEHVSQVLGRNRLFNKVIRRGQEVLGSTWLSDGLMTQEGVIDSSQLNSDIPSAFDAIKEANLRLCKQQRDRIESGKGTEQFGDDSMLGVMKAPTLEMQQFIREYIKFDALLWECQKSNPELYAKGKLLQSHIRELKADTTGDSLQELTNLIKAVNKAVETPTEDSVLLLLHIANQVKGAPSPAMKGFGIALMVFGAVLALVGGVVLSASGCAFLAGLLPVAAPSAAIGGGMVAGGLSIFSAGLGLFLGGKRLTHLAKEIHDVAKECQKPSLP
jgi:hypothetical protein